MKKLLLALGLITLAGYALIPAIAQNIMCPDRPSDDSSNACANTRWAKAYGGGGGGGGSVTWATLAERLAGTDAEKAIAPSVTYPPETVITYGTTTTIDFSTFLQARVTLTGNITTMTTTNVTGGRAGTIAFIQDGTGSRTVAWASVFKFAGGTAPTLSTTASAVDILSYSCRTTTFCSANLIKDVR